MVPPLDEMNINNHGKDGRNVITDRCATAQKLRQILVKDIAGAYNFDCMQHLRNVWFDGMKKALTKRLNVIL